MISQLNSPIVVLGAGTTLIGLLPLATAYCQTATVSLGILTAVNVLTFGINCTAVSIPGRIDGGAAVEVGATSIAGSSSSTKQDTLKANDDREASIYSTVYSPRNGRSLIAPAGWAFAIWGPIYIGEAVFCASLLTPFIFPTSAIVPAAVSALLPDITAPVAAAHLFQTLWCASFRPSYMQRSMVWEPYVSVTMLGGTAYCLSLVHASIAGAMSTGSIAEYMLMLPLTMHFGWTMAATLVNFNGSLAASNSNTVSDWSVIAVGHASSLVAVTAGVGLTVLCQSPAYGFTLAWALAACANGMSTRQRDRQQGRSAPVSSQLDRGMNVQRWLCYTGSGLCAAVAMSTAWL